MKPFYIITGGPGVGKTTLINELNNYGYQTVQECARKIIKGQIKTKSEGLPWKNKGLYSKLMFEASLESYDTINAGIRSDFIFFDRGILDSICHMEIEHILISYHIIK